jgi:hypothetical protein
MEMHTISRCLWLALLAPACVPMAPDHPHQTLSAPTAGAGEAERVAAYERLFASTGSSTVLVSPQQGVVAQTADFVVLGDGTRVYHPGDFAAVVAPDSPTARSGARADDALARARSKAGTLRTVMAIGFVGAIGGLALSGVGAATAEGTDLPVLVPVGGGIAAVSIIGAVAAMFWMSGDLQAAATEANDERVSAFATYNADLRKHLDVCVDGTRVTACPPSAAAAAPAPAPAPVPAP